MIRTFIDLSLAECLRHLFRQLRILEVCMSQPGCRSAGVTIAEDGSRAIATAVRDDHAACGRWLDHPDRARFGGATADPLNTPVSGEVTGARFRSSHLATSPGDRAGRGEEGR